MDKYELLKTIHVLAAVIWVGGGVFGQLLAYRIRKTNDTGRLAALGKDSEWIGTHVFLPASLLLLGMGIWMTIDAWAFEDTWIIIGIAGMLFSVFTGMLFLGPESKRLAVLLEDPTTQESVIAQRIDRLLLASRIELAVLLLVVVDMVIKPGA